MKTAKAIKSRGGPVTKPHSGNIARPAPKRGWNILKDSLNKFTPDFMAEWRQPKWPGRKNSRVL